MPLKLQYITNNLNIALIAEKYGVERIWIDLETLGKEQRQKNMDSVKSHHKIQDIETIKPHLTLSEILVRVNPWNVNSAQEIDAVINAGADTIMLPMWKSKNEVRNFLDSVNHRAKTTLLLETKEAVECLDEVLEMDFDEIHIGLNDLHLSYGKTFLFELLADGTVERLCHKFKGKGVPYGFGGIAKLGAGMLQAEKIVMEHYRLGSTRAILSRSFCNSEIITNLNEIEKNFAENMKKLREYELYAASATPAEYENNRRELGICVENIVKTMKGGLI